MTLVLILLVTNEITLAIVCWAIDAHNKSEDRVEELWEENEELRDENEALKSVVGAQRDTIDFLVDDGGYNPRVLLRETESLQLENARLHERLQILEGRQP